MKDLKTVLFEETLQELNNWKEQKKKFGDWDKNTIVPHAKFCSLYTVIEKSGLEEEYQIWKMKNNENLEKHKISR